MAKETQKARVLRIMKDQGYISRNDMLDLPYYRITRLGAIVWTLKEEGYEIETDEKTVKGDTIYRLKPKKVERYRIPATGEEFSKTIWV